MESPEFDGSMNGETGLSQEERNKMLAELARARQEAAQASTTAEVTARPELLAMLGKLTEGDPKLSPRIAAHLRRMIALYYNFYVQQAADAAVDKELHGIILNTVQEELDELSRITEGDNLPDMWDIAYEDLMRLEGKNE